jgi:hypothetical protein
LPVSVAEATRVAALRVKARHIAAQNPLARYPYAGDPVGFIQNRLREFIWSKQVEVARSVAQNRRTAVQSCHGAGKSYIAARLVAWWLESYPPGQAFVVTTAPSGPQVKAILWREINRTHAQARLSGRTNQTEWLMDVDGNEELVAFGRKPSDYNPAAFQGIHARFVLVILDEAGGVPESIYNAATSLTANDYSRLLAIGNPDDPSSYFAKVCGPDSGWNTVRVDAFDSPNFTGEAIPPELADMLIGQRYVEEAIRDGGENNPLDQSKVRGLFPELAPEAVIQLSFVRKCQQDRDIDPRYLSPVELGVDVGAGGDRTVIRERRGLAIGRVWRYSTPDPKEAAGYVVQAIRESGATRVKVDKIGIGWALTGWLQAMRLQGVHKAEVVGVSVSESSNDPQHFPKLRDQLWWQVGREAMLKGLFDLRGLDEATVAQLIAPKWKPDSLGRYQIEKKDETKKRIKRSPDDADALLLAFYSPIRADSGAAVAGDRRETAGYRPR